MQVRGTRRSFVSSGTVKPATLAIAWGDLPTMAIDGTPLSLSNMTASSFAFSSALTRYAPLSFMRATALSQVALSSKIIDWSEEQMVPLSKVLEAMMLLTATLRLADLDTNTGVLPGPTPTAG